jgi:hypothetical protein
MTVPSDQPQHDADTRGREQESLIDHITVAELVASADTDVPASSFPMPISVWHVTEPDESHGDDVVVAAVTAMIVASYSRPGDTIVSFGPDPVQAGTAAAAGCDYRPVTTAADLADLDHVAGGVALIMLRWPPESHDDAISEAALRDLFAACRMLLDRDGATITTMTAGPVGDHCQQHSRALIPAARDSGLNMIRHIVAVTEPATASSRRRSASTVSPVSALDDGQLAIRQHILMFTNGGGPFG